MLRDKSAEIACLQAPEEVRRSGGRFAREHRESGHVDIAIWTAALMLRHLAVGIRASSARYAIAVPLVELSGAQETIRRSSTRAAACRAARLSQ